MRSIALLGSTGSVGCSAVDLITRHPDEFSVELLVAGKKWEVLADQIRRLRPQVAGLSDEKAFHSLCSELGVSGSRPSFEGTRLICGNNEICDAISTGKAAVVVAAVVGMAGLNGVLAAVRAGKIVALANKESLVVAGRLVLEEARRHGAQLVPVDSEHSAIFQCLRGSDRKELSSVVLTASGGPFLNTPSSNFATITVEQALRHPKWSMGAKITIDSATMMNKALEVIEAHWLFDVTAEQVEVVIHPESIVHSFARFIDGSLLAQLSIPDMRGPIGYALRYPDLRLPMVMEHLDLCKVGQLNFLAVESEKFPGIDRALECLRVGGAAPAVFNAANEAAVEAFLQRSIGFPGINEIVGGALEMFAGHDYNSIDDLHAVCSTVVAWARQRVGFVSKYPQ